MISDWTKSLLLQEKSLKVNKLIIKGVFFSFLFCLAIPLFANNIRVDGKTKVTGFVGTDTAVIELNLQWDNSWRDDFNWDAAWVFFKYKKRGGQEIWHPAYLVREGHEATPLSGNEGGDYMFMFGEAGSGNNAKVTGLYVIRDGISEGNVRVKLRVKFPLSVNGLTKSDFGEDYQGVYVAVHAIEMVYIPYGAYSLGDGLSGNSFVSSEKQPLIVDSEDARSAYTLSSPSTPLSLLSSYPKGYAGFYVMKYEVSQEQYVEFLNSLTLSQQKSRVGNNDFEHMEKGDYVFGDLKRPNCRNGIAFISQPGKEGPAVFGNNLNPENDFFSVDDGQTLACNYLSPSDMLAYCDWSGLRPMSELEYEKACRRPYPQVPEKGEYAWNTASGVNALQSESELSYRWSENEQALSKQRNVNSGGKINGPVRCGLFGNSQTSQSESGATYWGVMDMGGNLWEMCYNAESAGSKFVGNDFSYSHGDGVLDAGGNTDISASYWPSVVGAIGVRGGSFASSESMLRTSDRTYAAGSYFSSFTTRDSSVGFRAARGVLNTTGFTAGNISCENGSAQDIICSKESFTITGTVPQKAVGKITYSWYISLDNGVTWNLIENQNGISLNYSGIENISGTDRTILLKRKDVCAVGEEWSNKVTMTLRFVKKPELVNYSLLAGLGHKLVLPAPLDGSLESKWQTAKGVEYDGKNAIIDVYNSSEDGIFKLYYVNSEGCESEKVNVTVKGISGIPIINYGTYRAWADGSYAKSANAYYTPAAPYVYQGATGTGIYKIDVDGSTGSIAPILAYCNMTANSGGWTLIFNHNHASGYWSGKDATKYNVNNPQANLYSILYLMEYFRGSDGKFYFWINYPTLSNQDNLWKQTANPNTITNVNKTGKAPGYQAVTIRTTANQWGGLAKTGTTASYLDGTWYVTNWYYSIGCNAKWNNQGIPGPATGVSQVKLWVK